MPTLKLFSGNWDGRRERAVVATSKTQAMALLGAGRKHMDDMFHSDTSARPATEVIWASPGVVFQRRMGYGPDADAWAPLQKTN